MKLTSRILIAALAAAIALPIAAQAAKGERRNKKNEAPPAFATVDKDSDSSISKDEFVAAMKEKLGEDAAKSRFAALDKDNNSKLSKEEYAAAGETEKKKRRRDK